MNRAVRRKLEKQGYSKATIMKQYGNEAWEAGFKAGFTEATEVTFYMTAYTIQYKLGFGKERLQRIMKQIYNNIDAYRTEHLDFNDYNAIKGEIQNKYEVNLL